MAKDRESSVSWALGIPEEDWTETIESTIISHLQSCDKVSDVLEKTGKDIKAVEFGGEFDLGTYEKRLLLAGMVVGKLILQNRDMGSLISKLVGSMEKIAKRDQRDSGTPE